MILRRDLWVTRNGPPDTAGSAGLGTWSWSNRYQIGTGFVRSMRSGQRGQMRVVKVGRSPCRTCLLMARSDLFSSSRKRLLVAGENRVPLSVVGGGYLQLSGAGGTTDVPDATVLAKFLSRPTTPEWEGSAYRSVVVGWHSGNDRQLRSWVDSGKI